nr:LamG domain-containing protein [Candidatus Neomarinimicrobiota bacterium]
MDKNALSQYQTDNFLRFDIFDLNNDLVHYGGWNTADTIDLSNKAVTLGSAFTQEVWIFSDQRGWTTQEIIGYTPSDDKNRSPSISTRDHGKSIGYGFGDGSDWYGEIATDVISTPGWYHVAVTFDGSDYKLFVNGSEVKNSSVAAGISPINTPVKYIGTYFQGKLDEVRIWNIARTESEINNDMNKRLTGSETNLVAYYPMDINGDYQLIDLSSNQNHGVIKNADVMQKFSSNDCSAPDGTESCLYPTINSALDDAQPGDRVLIKGGRYSEYIKRSGLNDVKIEGYLDENVIIDGTISLETEWVSYNHNGHNIYKTVIDFDSLSYRYGMRTDSVYSVFLNERYMMMSMPVNYKNPTDSINGDPKNVDPGTIYALKIKSPLQWSDEGYQPGELANLDSPEEWSFDPDTGILYLYPSDGVIPDKDNVRIRTRTRLVEPFQSDYLEFRNLHFFSGTLRAYDSDYLTVEDSKFSFSSDMKAKGANGTANGEYSWWTNLVFENINHDSPLNHSKNMFPTMENILFRNTAWFHYNWSYPPIVGRNFISTGSGSDNRKIGGDIWRYITVRDANSAGIFAGMRSLTEYIRIENVFGVGDNSSIQRNSASADSSTTRYVWVINGPD